MAPLSDASAIRVALIDDDSGLLTVLERRLGALRWEAQMLAFPPDAGPLAALRLHALIVILRSPASTTSSGWRRPCRGWRCWSAADR